MKIEREKKIHTKTTPHFPPKKKTDCLTTAKSMHVKQIDAMILGHIYTCIKQANIESLSVFELSPSIDSPAVLQKITFLFSLKVFTPSVNP